MSSDYTGTSGTTHTTVPMLDDGDRPSAALWRQSLEPIVDSIADLDSRTGGIAGDFVDGTNGGTYAPTNPIVINGDGLRSTTEIAIASPGAIVVENNADLRVESGGDIVVETGGDISLQSGAEIIGLAGSNISVNGELAIKTSANLVIENNGDLRVESGGDVVLESGADLIQDDGAVVTLNGTCNMTSSGELNLASGADIVCADGAQIQVDDPEDLLINASSMVFHVAMTSAISNGWDANISPVDGTWIAGAAVGDPDGAILFPLKLAFGDTLTSLQMVLDGGYGAGHPGLFGVFDVPILQLIRVDEAGDVTVVQAKADASANFAAFDVPHAVTMNSGALPYTNASSDVHFVRVIAEGGVSGVADTTRLTSVNGLSTARSFRRSPEVL